MFVLGSGRRTQKFKDEFALPEGVIYLDGNSLGARPKKSLSVAQHIISQEWGEDLINSWNKADWWGYLLDWAIR